MRRRNNGEGSIYKGKDGLWHALIYVTQVGGLRKRTHTSARTYEAVKTKVAKLKDLEKSGLIYSDKKWTVAEYLDYWLYDVHAKKVRETTMDAYRRAIKNHVKPTLGGYKLQDLSVRHMRQAMAILEERGVSGRMRNEARKIMSACLQWAMTEELLMRNVARLVEKPQHTPRETVVWTAEQASMFLQRARSHRLYIAFLLFMIYGMRKGEVLGLRYSDINFENNTIYVRQQIGRINEKLKARDVKTKLSRRVLPLNDHVRVAILEHAKAHHITIPPFNPRTEYSTEGTVVISEVGTALDPHSLTRCFNALIKELGLPHTTPHAMRHMGATFLKDAGTPLKDAQLILGHSDSAMTLWYQHGTPETHRAAISAIGQRLLG